MMDTICISSSLIPRQDKEWVIITATKDPPTQLVSTFLNTNGCKSAHFISIKVVKTGIHTNYLIFLSQLLMSWNLLVVLTQIKMEKVNHSMICWCDGLIFSLLILTSSSLMECCSCLCCASKNRQWYSVLDCAPF